MINPTTSSLIRGYTRQSAQTGSTGPEEKQMIQDRSPESNRMSPRLYGRSRPVGQAPARIGSLLDIKG